MLRTALSAFAMTLAGTIIPETSEIGASDWTQPGVVPFNIEMSFTVSAETIAALVLEEDMPNENGQPKRVEIPLVLAPSQ
jgi:hypothetical protein